jgi:TetR/AcrR family transcriptional regulator, regulator of biofilm formation and stress response
MTSDPVVKVDGRQARGDRARAALIEATLDVIEREGVAKVTHRNVTRVAGLPATSAAYHFASINDLLEAALLWADEQSKDALVGIGRSDDPVDALARWLVADFETNRSRCIAEYELFLYAARVPSLRPTARRWLTDLAELVRGWTPEESAVATTCAYVDGLILQALVTGEAPELTQFVATLRSLAGSPAPRRTDLAKD